MGNPWLEIPLEDYEGHMSFPSIGQARMLADEFERLIVQQSPASVAIIGCAGGNGLERIDGGKGQRVVAVDINPAYLEAASRRHAPRLRGLEICCADVQTDALRFDPVEFIYAALIFEYVDPAAALAMLRRHCVPGGSLAVLLQLPNPGQQAVSPSPYHRLSVLSPLLRLVEPAVLRRTAAAAGFAAEDSRSIGLRSGKCFELQMFRAHPDPMVAVAAAC
jgi:SAM-dependent methyltransferase